MSFIMVLNDGTTFTDLHGCMIMEMPDDVDEYDIPEKCQLIRRFGEEPRPYDHLHDTDVFVIAKLEKVKERLMAVDGWSKNDLDTINQVIARLS